MKRILPFLTAALLGAVLLTTASCKSAKKDINGTEGDTLALVGPAFSGDSAYAYAARQCDFGARTMNSEAHDRCGEWIANQFRAFGLDVETQQADLRGYDGTMLHSTNIIAHYRPEAQRRILLCAHWDSRPWADNDPDSTNWHKPVMAANDGASGVAVMLEIARLLQADTTATVGVDFVCFDAEDWGTPQWAETADDADTWALGAQYWATHQGNKTAKPAFGILLDMVGGEGARFYHEGVSLQYAGDIVRRIWRTAAQMGYASFFPDSDGGMITDDHVPVNEKAGIPTIDIIAYYPDCAQSSFGPTWHTVSDTMDHIDANVLKAVGQVLVQTIYEEQ